MQVQGQGGASSGQSMAAPSRMSQPTQRGQHPMQSESTGRTHFQMTEPSSGSCTTTMMKTCLPAVWQRGQRSGQMQEPCSQRTMAGAGVSFCSCNSTKAAGLNQLPRPSQIIPPTHRPYGPMVQRVICRWNHDQEHGCNERHRHLRRGHGGRGVRTTAAIEAKLPPETHAQASHHSWGANRGDGTSLPHMGDTRAAACRAACNNNRPTCRPSASWLRLKPVQRSTAAKARHTPADSQVSQPTDLPSAAIFSATYVPAGGQVGWGEVSVR